MTDTQTPEEVAGARIREIRVARHLTQSALATAMNALGHSWHQTTAAKTEAAERPLRLNEITDLARVLGVEVSYILAPIPGENRWKFSADLRELLRLEEIAEKLEAEAMELHREFKRKTEDSQLARRQIGELQERLREAGVMRVNGRWQFPEGTDGER